MDDKDLRQMVIDELEWTPSVDASRIGVAVKDGIVTLTGQVSSYAERVFVEDAVQRIKGTRAIAQEIEIRLPFEKKTADSDIAKRAADILKWDATIPSEGVHVKVQNGFITLSGIVDWQYQRQAAEAAVRRLSGVVGVANLIALRPTATSIDLKRRIEEALKRNAEAEASHVTVSVRDGCVILEGEVKAFYERGIIENAAWTAPGVQGVEDRLRVRV